MSHKEAFHQMLPPSVFHPHLSISMFFCGPRSNRFQQCIFGGFFIYYLLLFRTPYTELALSQ